MRAAKVEKAMIAADEVLEGLVVEGGAVVPEGAVVVPLLLTIT